MEKAEIELLVKPQARYVGQTGQQRTMFVLDYSGNWLEFNSMANDEELFST